KHATRFAIRRSRRIALTKEPAPVGRPVAGEEAGQLGAGLGLIDGAKRQARHGSGPLRLAQRSQRIEVRRVPGVAVVDAEFDGAVPEALQRLAQVPAQAALALPAHLVEIDLDRNELVVAIRLVEDLA